jgi:hypothetical protein
VDIGRHVQGEVIALGVRRDHLDRRAGFAEDEDVGAAGDPDETLAGHHRLEEIGTAPEGHELGGEPFGLEQAPLEGDDDGPGHRVIAEDRGADLDRGLRASGPRDERRRARREGGGEEAAARDHGHGQWPP